MMVLLSVGGRDWSSGMLNVLEFSSPELQGAVQRRKTAKELFLSFVPNIKL